MAERLAGAVAGLILRGDGDPESQVRSETLLRGVPPGYAVILYAGVALILNDPGAVGDHHVHGRGAGHLFLPTNADRLPGTSGVAGQIHFRDAR